VRHRLGETLGLDRRNSLGRAVPRPLLVAVSRRFEPPVIDEALRAGLTDYYCDDVARLRSFTGQAFASWSV
jgi:hypothetical protein